jgi:drug/metabolite transporter (DMT)-like permease
MILCGSLLLPVGLRIYHDGLASSVFVMGDAMIVTAAFLYAVDIGISHHVAKKISPERISQIAAFAGFSFALILIVLLGVPFDITWDNLPYVVYFGVFVIGLSYYFFLLALRLIGIIKTIIVYSTVSSFGVVFSGVFLGESINALNVLSLLLAVSGIYLLRNTMSKIEQ